MSRRITSFIDGAFVTPQPHAVSLPIFNPATGQVIAELVEADESESGEILLYPTP